MKYLNQDIGSKQFKQVYLLYGDEDYLKRKYKNSFIKAMIPDGNAMNLSVYEGKGTVIGQVIDQAETMPFFGPRRLLVFENTGLFKSGGGELADYLKDMPETTFFLFVENEVDRKSRLYKAVDSKGRAVELKTQKEDSLKRWVAKLAEDDGKSMSDSVIVYFLTKVGVGMDKIQREYEKLSCYCLERDEITREDVDAVCVSPLSNRIYDMVDAVARKERRKALELYYELITLKEKPSRILALMIRQYQVLYHIKGLLREGVSQKEIVSKTGIPFFAVSKNMSQAKMYRSKDLRRIIEEGVQLEQEMKTGLIKDQLAVEVFLVKNSGGDSPLEEQKCQR